MLRGFHREIMEDDGLTTKQKQLILCMIAERGIVSRACAVCGVSREVHYDGVRNNEAYKKWLVYVNETIIDWVEEKLYECIDDKNFNAIKFKLLSHGKSRGYNNDNQINLNIGNIIKIVYEDAPQIEQPFVDVVELEEEKQIDNQIILINGPEEGNNHSVPNA